MSPKNRRNSKLHVRKEALKALSEDQLKPVAGGGSLLSSASGGGGVKHSYG